MKTTHYVATENGLKYSIVALGATAEEAKKALVAEFVRTNNAGYGIHVHGVAIRTVAAFEDYYGIRVYGPLGDGEAATES